MRRASHIVVAIVAVTCLSCAGASAHETRALPTGIELALPSLYRVEVRTYVPAVRVTRPHRVPGDTPSGPVIPIPAGERTITRVGTAFAVNSDGVLVTAGHVAIPSPEVLAIAAAPRALAAHGLAGDEESVRKWVREGGVVPVTPRKSTIRVWHAQPPQGTPGVERARPATLITPSPQDDLALMKVPDTGVPGLPLDDATSVGTRVTIPGFGASVDRRGPLHPWLREGTFVGSVSDDDALVSNLVNIAVVAGDSGSPVLDSEGAVRGVVFARAVTKDGTVYAEIAPATRLRRLANEHRVAIGPGQSGRAYRDAVFAARKGDVARTTQAVERAEAAYPVNVMLPYVRALAAENATDNAARQRRRLFLAIVAGVLLMGSGVLFWRAQHMRPSRHGVGRRSTEAPPPWMP